MRGLTASQDKAEDRRKEGQARDVQGNISEDSERQAGGEKGRRKRAFRGVSQQENGKRRRGGAAQVERHNLPSLIIYHHIPLDILLSPQTWTMSRSA